MRLLNLNSACYWNFEPLGMMLERAFSKWPKSKPRCVEGEREVLWWLFVQVINCTKQGFRVLELKGAMKGSFFSLPYFRQRRVSC